MSYIFEYGQAATSSINPDIQSLLPPTAGLYIPYLSTKTNL